MGYTESAPKRHTISVRKGDNVRVMSGRDAGKNGELDRVAGEGPWTSRRLFSCLDLGVMQRSRCADEIQSRQLDF